MKKCCSFAEKGRKPGSYLRREYENDIILNRFFHYRELYIRFSRRAAKIKDAWAEEMEKLGLITVEEKTAYLERVSAEYTGKGVFYDCFLEEIYRHVCDLRREYFGAEALEQFRAYQTDQGLDFQPGTIHQYALKDQKIQESRAVVFALCEASFYPYLLADLQKAEGKEIYFLVSEEKGALLPTRAALPEGYRYLTFSEDGVAYDATLQKAIDEGDAFLLVYGEDGLLGCRELLMDAAVYAVPQGFQARAAVNRMDGREGCLVYIPKGFDISRWVRITARTRISYWHLARLREEQGPEVYTLAPEQLYQRYPQYFMDIYQNGPAFQDWQIPMRNPESLEEFDDIQDQAIKAYLDGTGNIRYYSKYFDEQLKEAPICRDSSQPQSGILVQAVRVNKSKSARVIACEKGRSLRQTMQSAGKTGRGVLSNFLFFLTPTLAELYNELRSDRPREQGEIATGHLDYLLEYREGKRIETFPLFRKTCLAMKEDGSFLFCNFRLGGGTVTLGTNAFSWKKEDVDPTEGTAPVAVFTPYLSLPDEEAERGTYRKAVGEGRVNIVILQDKIACIRKGDVLLPGIGVVVSLEEQLGEKLLKDLPAFEDGYYDPRGLDFSLRLDPPAGVEPAVWEGVRWAYGGGLSLIIDGEALTDRQDPDQWFREEGWMSPLSRQTQESSLHTMVKHPRTAIGTTREGDLVILVFSGRTWRSTGADYGEMITIARSLFPDVQYLMNVDGGGSAMLGMVQDGKFMELSCPSTSLNSIVGMVRPINTVFYLPAEE